MNHFRSLCRAIRHSRFVRGLGDTIRLLCKGPGLAHGAYATTPMTS